MGSSAFHCDLTVNINTACKNIPVFTVHSTCSSKFTDRMPEGDSAGESIHGKPSAIGNFFKRLGQVRLLEMTIQVISRPAIWELQFLFEIQIYQSWLDKSTPFSAVRWAATLILTAIYMIRVYILQVKHCALEIIFLCLFRNICIYFIWFIFANMYTVIMVVDWWECSCCLTHAFVIEKSEANVTKHFCFY